MAFCSFAKEAGKSLTTSIDNSFFTDYLTEADGEAVKVYLYGLYLCRNNEGEFTLTDMAKALFADEEKIKDCFRYWEEFDAVSVTSDDPFLVKYLPLTTYGRPKKFRSGKYDDFNKSMQSLITDRMISTNEYAEYISVMEDYNIRPDAMLMIAKYCVDTSGTSVSGRYIINKARKLAMQRITTVEAVEAELSDYNSSSAEVQKVLTAIGIKRKADIDDFNYFSKWTSELMFTPASVIFAAKKFKAKTLQRLDGVLMELYGAKKFSEKEISDYFDKKEEVASLSKEITRKLSVYYEIIQPVVDTYINPWLSLGFEKDSLLFIADFCFKRRRRTLESMDETVKNLYKQGLVTQSAIASYLKKRGLDEEFIKDIFALTGEDRKPNEWDRKTLAAWREWGFSDDMIKAAAPFAAGKSSPMVYINAILGDWKSKGIFSPDKIPEEKQSVKQNSGKNNGVGAYIDGDTIKSAEFKLARTYTKAELDALIDDIENVDF